MQVCQGVLLAGNANGDKDSDEVGQNSEEI